jgi:type IV secretion system protein VirD4
MKHLLELIAKRSLILRRVKQVLLAALVLIVAWWLLRLGISPRWRYGLTFVVVAGGLLYLAVHECRYMAEHFGFRLLPPGWGSLQPRTAHGEGRFLSFAELLLKFRWERGGIFLGRLLPQHRPFGLFKRVWIGPAEDRHMLTVAGTRIGKGTAALIPNLLLYPGSALVIDPKGELAQITAARRGSGSSRVRRCLQQEVFVLDPEHQVPNATKARWNPLAELNPADPDLVTRVQKIAYALVPPEPNAHDQFFINQARDLLTMLILHVLTAEPPDRQHLIYVRRLLAQGDTELFALVAAECRRNNTAMPYADAMDALLQYMAASQACGGKIAGFAQRLVAMPPETRNTIVGDLYTRTSFLDQAGLEHMLQASEFSLADLKRKPMTVYVCMRGTSLATTMRPIAYILVDLAILAMEAVQEKPPFSVLFAMDEFYMLGRHESIDRAMGLIAGFDVKLWPVVQGISQLKAHYPSTWDNFIRNCGAVQYAGDQEPGVLQELQTRGGTVFRKLADGRIDRQPLLSVYELSTNYFSRESRRQLVFFQQQPAAPLEFVDYYTDPYLSSLAEAKATVQSASSASAWAGQGRSVRLP